MRLSVVSHFYNASEAALRQIRHWEAMGLSPQQVEFILVDDCSEIPFVPPHAALNLRCARVGSDIAWNQAGCRNLGVYLARGEWVLMFDIDQVLSSVALATILGSLSDLDQDTLYYLRCAPIYNSIDKVMTDFHVNSYLVHTERFLHLGMYDEDFCGAYGYEDLFLPWAWEHNGGRRGLLNGTLFFDQELTDRTTGLDRDLSRNMAILRRKLGELKALEQTATWRPQGILRFQWSLRQVHESPPRQRL